MILSEALRLKWELKGGTIPILNFTSAMNWLGGFKGLASHFSSASLPDWVAVCGLEKASKKQLNAQEVQLN